MSKEVTNRLKKAEKIGRSLTLKIMVRAKDAPIEAPKVSCARDSCVSTSSLISPSP